MSDQSYVGNKNFPGVIEFLINRLPKSNRYFSLFLGSAGLELSVYTSSVNFICAEKNLKLWTKKTKPILHYKCYQDLLEDNVFTSADFIFADPPYRFCSRRSGKKYYEFEFSELDHIAFLNYMVSIKAKIMITHPKNKMYCNALRGWYVEDFSYMTRGGWFHDALYTNYDTSSIILLNYKCLGSNFVERQAIKRQRKNIVEKFKRLPKHIRDALILNLKREKLL